MLAPILVIFNTHTDSTLFRYSPGFYNFSVLTQIRPFSRTRQESFSILARILPFPGTRPDITIFWYSTEQLFDTRTDSTFSRHSPVFYHFSELPVNGPFSVLTRTIFRYSHGFYHFSVLTLIGPFSSTHLNSFSILARILPFPGTHPYSTIFRNSH